LQDLISTITQRSALKIAISKGADTVQQITVLFSVYKLSVVLKKGEYSSLKIKFSYALLEVVFI